MTSDRLTSIETKLASYSWLQECVLEGLRWDRMGTIFHLDFEYIWDDHGIDMGKLAETPKRVTVSLIEVHELHIENDLSASVVAHPELLNWGLSEISRIYVSEADRRRPGSVDDAALLLVSARWENDRQIDVVCADVEITESLMATENDPLPRDRLSDR